MGLAVRVGVRPFFLFGVPLDVEFSTCLGLKAERLRTRGLHRQFQAVRMDVQLSWRVARDLKLDPGALWYFEDLCLLVGVVIHDVQHQAHVCVGDERGLSFLGLRIWGSQAPLPKGPQGQQSDKSNQSDLLGA